MSFLTGIYRYNVGLTRMLSGLTHFLTSHGPYPASMHKFRRNKPMLMRRL